MSISIITEFLNHRYDDLLAQARGLPASQSSPMIRLIRSARTVMIIHGQYPESGIGYVDPVDRDSYGSMPSVCQTCGTPEEYAVAWPCATIKALTRIFQDHPGYQEEWGL